MPETTTPATELASQYIAQVTGDLEANLKEQERISAEIASLQEQLVALQRDHSVLVNMRQALGIEAAPAEPAAETQSATVPSPRRGKAGATPDGKQKARKSTTTRPRKKAAGKPEAKTAGAAKAAGKPEAKAAGAAKAAGKPETKAAGAAKTAQPTLVELIRHHLAEQKEPRSAAEVSAALNQAHPDRDIATKVVRVTLEALVAKSQAERTKQGRSVFYTASASEPTAASGTEAQPENSEN
ncbi:BlaI/MecI/CopY family transcriptional regulator [Streptomyces coeruleorubidus]|uniref:BlaI/MecI/CopY family transcriptional regulator n=1 Tax=Streptomyces coeruleorubidus TaxID=116188 RepID=UPI00364F6D11